MFPLRKTWVLNQEIHWVPIIGTPAVPASCFQVPEQRIVVWLLFYLRLDFKAFCPCVLLFFAIMTPQFQEPSCPSFSRACLYSYTSALLFLSSSDIIFFSYPAPNLSFEIFPLVVLYGIVGIGYLLPNFHWPFFPWCMLCRYIALECSVLQISFLTGIVSQCSAANKESMQASSVHLLAFYLFYACGHNYT